MKKCLALMALCIPAFAQLKQNTVTIIPKTDLSATGQLLFRDKQATPHTIGFQAPTSVAANFVWVLPGTDGTNGQCLKTDGSGGLTFGGCTTGSNSLPIFQATNIGGGGGPASTVGIAHQGVGLIEFEANYPSGGTVDGTHPGLNFRLDPRLSGEALGAMYMQYPTAINSGALVPLYFVNSTELSSQLFGFTLANGTYLKIGGTGNIPSSFSTATTIITGTTATFGGLVTVKGDVMPDTNNTRNIGSNTVRVANGYFTNLFCSGTCPAAGLPSTGTVTVGGHIYDFGGVTEGTALFELGFNTNNFGTQYTPGAGGMIRFSDGVVDKPVSFWVRQAAASSPSRVGFFDYNGTTTRYYYQFAHDLMPDSTLNYNIGDSTHLIADIFGRNADFSESPLPMPGNGYVKMRELLLADYGGVQPGNWHVRADATTGGLGSNVLYVQDAAGTEFMRMERKVVGSDKNQLVMSADIVGTGPNYMIGASSTTAFKYLPFKSYWAGGASQTGAFYGGNTGGTFGSPTGTAINSTLAQFGGIGHDTLSWLTTPAAGMSVVASENWSASPAHTGAYLTFFTTQAGTSNVVNRVSITGAGGDNSTVVTLGDFLGGSNGAFKYNATTHKMQWSNDLTTYTDLGSVSNTFLPFVLATTFGAVCDGSSHTVTFTADYPLSNAAGYAVSTSDQKDWAAIQEAILTAKSLTSNLGGTVQVPAGNCQINRTINIGDGTSGAASSYHGITLKGQGTGTSRVPSAGLNQGATTLKWIGSSAPMISVNGSIGGVVIRDLFLHCGADACTYAIDSQHAYNFLYENLIINTPGTAGIRYNAYGTAPSPAPALGSVGITRNVIVKALHACSAIGFDVGNTTAPGGSGLDVASSVWDTINVTGDPTVCGGSDNRIGIRLNYTDSDRFTNVNIGQVGNNIAFVVPVSGATFPKQITFYSTWLDQIPTLNQTNGTWVPSSQHGVSFYNYGDEGGITCPTWGSTYVRCSRADGIMAGNFNYQSGLSINGNITMDSGGNLAALGGAWNAIQSSGGFRTDFRFWGGFSGSYDPAGAPFSTLGQLALNTTDSAIQLQKAGGFAGIVADAYGSTSVSVSKGRHANGTVASPTITAAGDTFYAIGGHGCYRNTNDCFTTSANAQIVIGALQAFTNSGSPSFSPVVTSTEILMQTTPASTASRAQVASFYADSSSRPTMCLGSVAPHTIVGTPGAYSTGCLRYNSGTLEMSNDTNTWTSLSGSGGGFTSIASNVFPAASDTYAIGDDTHRWQLVEADNFAVWGVTTGVVRARLQDTGIFLYNVSGVNTWQFKSSGTIIPPGGSAGATNTITVRNSAGTGTCTLSFDNGIYTGGTC